MPPSRRENIMLQAKKIADLRGHEAAIYALASGRDGHVFTAGGDGWIVDWDLAAPDFGRLAAKTDGQLFSLLFLAEKNTLVAGDMNGGVRWIDLENPDAQRNVAHHRRGVFDAQLIDNQVVTLGGDGFLTRWDIEKKAARESVQLSSKSLRACLFLEKRGEIAVAASDGSIYFLDSKSLEQKAKIASAHAPSVFCLAVSEDEKRLFSGGRDARLRVWDLENALKMLADLPAHNFAINSLAADSEDRFLASASRDRTIKIWDLETLELQKVIETVRSGGHIRSVNRLILTQKGPKNEQKRLISASDDRSAVVWEIFTTENR